MLRFECSTMIRRPVEEVFAVLADFSNGSKWASGAVEPAVLTSGGEIGVGSTWRVVGKIVGRRFESDVTYDEFEPDRRIVFSTTKPYPTTSTVTLERVPEGTRVDQLIEGEPGGFYKLAQPLVESMARRQFQGDLENLRDLMEAGAL